MLRHFLLTILLISGINFLPLTVLAAPTDYVLLEPTLVNQNNPGTTIGGLTTSGGATGFAAYFQLLYSMMMAVGVLACIFYFVWGGFRIMVSTVPGVKQQGKEDIYRSLEGLAFILGAYLILNTINPRLTKIDLGLIKINTTAGDATSGLGGVSRGGVGEPTNYDSSTGGKPLRQYGAPEGTNADPNRFQADSPGQGKYGYLPKNEFEVRDQLKNAGVNINDSGECKPNSLSGCRTYVGGVNSNQISGVIQMKQQCNCEVTITGGAEQAVHTAGSRHFNGNAVDIRMTAQITQYVSNNPGKFWWTNNEGDHWHLEFK